MSRPFTARTGTVYYDVPPDEGAILARTSFWQSNLINRRTGVFRRIYNYDFQPVTEHFLAFTQWMRMQDQARGEVL